MKAVIMQVRGKKSIVLYSNGKFGSIPTPPGCEEGSVLTIYLNNRLRILIITLAAVLILALGVFIGVSVVSGINAESKTDTPTATETIDDGTPGWQRGQNKQQEIEKKFPEH